MLQVKMMKMMASTISDVMPQGRQGDLCHKLFLACLFHFDNIGADHFR